MAELLTMLGELLVSLLRAVTGWVQVAFEGLITLACFLFSKKHRAERLILWRSQPGMKWLDISLATLWFLIVVGLPIYLLRPLRQNGGQPVTPVFVKAGTNEDVRIELRAKQTNDPRTVATISIKKHGVVKIADTKSLGELKTQLVENVSIFDSSSSSRSIQTNR